MGKKDFNVEEYRIGDGVRIILLPIPYRRALVTGFWVLSGSALEPEKLQGINHFLEHIVFRGTENFSSREIVENIESLGGGIDAYTSKEETCYYATVLGENVDMAVRILSDLVSRPMMRPKDVEMERNVIFAEIDDINDEPESLAQELFLMLLFGNTSLGRPIMGTQKTVAQISRDDLADYWRNYYCDENILIGAAGAVEPLRFVELVSKYLSCPRMKNNKRKYNLKYGNDFDGKFVIIPRVAQQIHFFVGVRTFPFSDERRYALVLLDVILGRGSSSRLFQIIREEMGLAYNIQSFYEFYTNTGLWAVYAGTPQTNLNKTANQIFKQINEIAQSMVSEKELNNAKNFIRGRLLLSAESLWTNLNRTIESYRYLNHSISAGETTERIMAVSAEEINRLAQELFTPQKIVAFALGDINTKEIQDIPLEIVETKIAEIFPAI
ncbi:hypothetical protein DRQ33_01085 [bacterium]|nr:MAG: hypothetical protein DRQ33_01085 [bacterium]